LKNTIIISDLHLPYHHRDAFAFLAAVKDVYDIKIVKNSGDLTDNHFSSYHEIESGAYSGAEELRQSRIAVKTLEAIFPEMTIVEGNHDILTRRKARTANIPEEHIRHPNEIYDVNWNWVERDFFKINKDQDCLLTHSISGSTLNNAKQFSHCSIMGHHHSLMGIEYFGDTNTLRWSMTVGCLINDHSPVFTYNKKTVLKRPLIGCGLIIDDTPQIVPLVMTKSGRWNKRI